MIIKPKNDIPPLDPNLKDFSIDVKIYIDGAENSITGYYNHKDSSWEKDCGDKIYRDLCWVILDQDAGMARGQSYLDESKKRLGIEYFFDKSSFLFKEKLINVPMTDIRVLHEKFIDKNKNEVNGAIIREFVRDECSEWGFRINKDELR